MLVTVEPKYPPTDLAFPTSEWNHDQRKWARQAVKFEQIKPLIKNFGMAIDGGAFCGVWTIELMKHFDEVMAFEPDRDNRQCLMSNIINTKKDFHGVYIKSKALGDKDQTVQFKKHPSPTSHHVYANREKEDPDYEVQMRTIDSYELDNVGFIKLDLEGYDLFGLKGAIQTIKRCKPVICIEMKGAGKRYSVNDKEIRKYLNTLGYTLEFRSAPDEIYAHHG